MKHCRKCSILQKEDIEVSYDDRRDATAGTKLADADCIGIPWRVVVSEKTMEKKGVEIKKRNEKDSQVVSLKEAVGMLHD